MNSRKNIVLLTASTLFCYFQFAFIAHVSASNIPDPYLLINKSSKLDTIPLKDRQGDFINDNNNNPFDITPSQITQTIEYDAKTDRYYIIEKIGDEYYRSPTFMTFEEYLDYKSKEQERLYFQSLAGVQSTKKGGKVSVDPMDKIDIGKSLVDRLFGGTEVDIKPQGSVDLTLGLVEYRKSISAVQSFGTRQKQWFIPGDFNIVPRLTVNGKIGTKMNLDFNYDTQSTFNFDKKLKLNYDTSQFSEDDIIKKIEAGDVSLPLKGNLIQGAQALFGVKTELQFGHLRVTALASEQRSKQNNLKLENGVAIQEFEIYPDEYDENRHFFLSHYNRETYENNLSNLPQVVTPYRLTNIEVWISDDRPNYNSLNGLNQQSQTYIAAISDIAEGDASKYTNSNSPLPISPMPQYLLDTRDPLNNIVLPDNRVNPLFKNISSDPLVKDQSMTSTILSGTYGLEQTTDFEIFKGRMLTPNEYTYNSQLGTISLNIRLRSNQVLAVSYKYYYTQSCDSIFTVGQLINEGIESSENRSTEEFEPNKVVFAKLLKATNQQVNLPSWDLMMKNVYNMRTSQLNKEGFEFDIYYEDDFSDGSLKKYIPDTTNNLNKRPLLEIFNLDNLNRFGDPQADGVFDYVPGITVNERSGSIIFPVLEPFGSSLDKYLTVKDDPIRDSLIKSKYKFQELYDTTVTIGRQALEKNKFVMRGRVKAENDGEINLGPFVPQGSVRVSAGSIELYEGQDYEIDYALGRLRITNPAYINQPNLNIRFEDNTTFSLQQKSMLGLRLDYDFSKKLAVGATFLRMKERPFTPKVNLGDEPIKNKIFGVDLNYSSDAPFITTLADKLPFYSTKAPSSVNLTAEAAYLIPGHASSIETTDINGENSEPVVSIDDFEGAVSGFSLGGFNVNAWILSSTPREFPEYDLSNNLTYGANRARINWYQLDQASRRSGDIVDPYTRQISQTELFNRPNNIGQNELYTFDIGYYPSERGPYNFDIPSGYPGYTKGVNFDGGKLTLNDPKSRWAGIMRYFQTTDFEASNYQAIEFWVLNPFMDRQDGMNPTMNEEGEMVFNLGNVSEDVLRDNLQFYENGLPTGSDNDRPLTTSVWGKVPLTPPINQGFENENGEKQDLGFDGLTDDEERENYADYLSIVASQDPTIQQDPSGDNFVYFNDGSLENQNYLITRMKDFNNPQGNTPFRSQGNEAIRGNRLAESEDMNNNKSLDQGESYYEYRIKFRNNNGELDTSDAQVRKFYKQTRTIINSAGIEEKWYRIQVPINDYNRSFGITGFRAIQFMRLYLTNFEQPKTFRMADFQLVRNTWRKSETICGDQPLTKFTLDELGTQENSSKTPFNYVTPKGIKSEELPSYNGTRQTQDENSLIMVVDDLGDCPISMNKLTKIDLNLYKKLQLFVHLEERGQDVIEDDSIAVFVKIGKDLVNNYYEYEMPLKVSKKDIANPNVQANIWPIENFLSIKLDNFIELKKLKISSGSQRISMPDPDKEGAIFSMAGVPSLGYIKVIEIGVKNKSSRKHNLEVWVNELRAKGLDEKGGYAAQAKLQVKVADLADLNVSTLYNSTGFGSLDKRLLEREQRANFQFDAATTMQLGKLLPKFIPISIPFFAQYTKEITTPRFDPYQRDLEVREAIALEGDEARQRAREVTTVKNISFTNVRKDNSKSSGGTTPSVGKDPSAGKSNSTKPKTPKPWSLDNISASYSWSETKKVTPIIASDNTNETKISLDYNYSNKSNPIKPLKFIKPKALKLLSEFNFNLLPSNLGFNTTIDRYTNARTFRLPTVPVFRFDDQRFRWERNYTLDWDLSNSLRFNFRASSSSIVDELRQTGIADNADDRLWVDENGNEQNAEGQSYSNLIRSDAGYVKDYRNSNLKNLGRNKNYTHQTGLSYRVPLNLIPGFDWVTATAEYKANYAWTAGPLLLYTDGLAVGNTIQNGQNRAANATFNFEKLYSKSAYLKAIDKGKQASKTRSKTRSNSRNSIDKADDKADDDKSKTDDKTAKDKKSKAKKEEGPSTAEMILIRPLLALRSVKLSYKEDLGTTVPGFEPEAKLLGLNDGFNSPGWGFVAGLQPDLDKNNSNNWLQSNTSWFNRSVDFNDQISQNKKHNYSAKIALEPFKDFNIDVDLSKDYREDHTEIFKYKDGGFMQIARNDVGSYEYSYIGMNSLFKNSNELYDEFKRNTEIVSHRITTDTTTHSKSPLYVQGYGPLNNQVVLPAFLATYTGKSLDQLPFNIASQSLNQVVSGYNFIPKPNWNVRYDGLSKLPMFKDIFSSFNIKHGYKSTISVSRYYTDITYNENNPNQLKENGDYYSKLIIPTMSINQQFSPLIGISVKTKNDMTFNVEYKKSRKLDLTETQMNESFLEEFVFGYGYIIKDFKGFGKPKKARKKKVNEDGEEETAKTSKKKSLFDSKGRSLTMNFDVSYRDNGTFQYDLATGLRPETTRSQKSFSLSPNVEYQMYKNLALRFFVEYNQSRSDIASSFQSENFKAGGTVKFTFN